MEKNKKLYFENLGRISYKEAWDYQTKVFTDTVETKLENRRKEIAGLPQETTNNYFLFCEHNHVYTLGKSGDKNNLFLNEDNLKQNGIEYFKINRGGDITYHGPGQVVGYPILDLDHFITDIHLYMRNLEEVIIKTLADYDIRAGRIEKLTGVWIDYEKMENPRKICAMGVKMSRWVTMHGFALNVNTDLNYFNNMNPCGITDKAVTSIQKELNRKVDLQEVEKNILKHFVDIFEIESFEEQFNYVNI
ncbi:lipoyl(octanoyl) transferase LipB [Chondrinema litorale]|uniref:lipoyl(octanoyl) transferase LipB n=1 Tax=Chondrinema litorale TaxID=2994555 RepID=UPI002544A807|nr:lipoyl(octanoyl) transferase LipB [Chondrinema litorale]UZR92735.1 lipoyl(octanoyl) transferase LipB [Chondrinema litorale]